MVDKIHHLNTTYNNTFVLITEVDNTTSNVEILGFDYDNDIIYAIAKKEDDEILSIEWDKIKNKTFVKKWKNQRQYNQS
jgi:hypothetical protein